MNRYEIGLFDHENQSNKEEIDRLEELFIKYNFRKSFVTFGKGLLNTPFINLFYTRAALDILFLNELREAAKPGYLRRQETNLKKDRGHTFAVPRTLEDALN